MDPRSCESLLHRAGEMAAGEMAAGEMAAHARSETGCGASVAPLHGGGRLRWQDG